MAKQVKHRRGTTAQVAAMTPAEGEIVIDTTKDTACVGDGATAGGIELAKADGTPIGQNTPAAGTFTTLEADTASIGNALNNPEGFTYTQSVRGLLVAGATSGEAVQYMHRDDVTISAGNILGVTYYTGADGVDVIGASARAESVGSFSASSGASKYIIATTPSGSTSPVDALTVDSSGNAVVGASTAGATSAATLYATGAGKFSTGSSGASAHPNGDDLVVEASSCGASLLSTDANTSRMIFGSPSENQGLIVDWTYDSGAARIRSNKVGATLALSADDTVTNLTLSGASGSELLTAAGSVSVTDFLRTPYKSELTIASGVVTATGSHHFVDTESDAATDDLDTINGGTSGDRVVFRCANNSRDVVFKDATGNLRIAGDFTLTNSQDTIELMFDGSNWIQLSRSNNT